MQLRFPFRRTIGGFLCLNFIIFSSIALVSWFNFPASFFSAPADYIIKHPYFQFDLDEQEPRNPEQKCILPRLHPFHPSIWNHLKFPKDIFCKKRQSDLTYVDTEGTLLFNMSEVKEAGYEIGKNLFCYWSPILRDGDDRVKFGIEVYLSEQGCKLPIYVSLIRVTCKNYASFEVYEIMQAHIHVPSIPPSTSPKHSINVLIFGLDSMSRLSFIRHLPRTYRYLTEELNMTVMRGMTKVGDNTFPNLVPILTGHKGYGDGLTSKDGFYDHWPFIWEKYSKAGYSTLWAEDLIKFGLFNYLSKGFHEPPTDHYIRPYWLAIENTNLLKYSSYMCYGSNPKYFVQMDYLKRFLHAYKTANIPYFAFSFLAELSHDYTTRIASADRYFEEFFMMLKNDGYLENTILFVMSDHGHRFDSIRATEVGHIEERLPFHSIYIPPLVSSLQPRARDILQLNSGRLITPFDVYATLVDILKLAVHDRPLGLVDPESERLGQTLFREVPLERTCSDASIPINYCTCQTDSEISGHDDRAKLAAKITVANINEVLSEGGLGEVCAVRTLRTIVSANLVHTEEDKESASDYKVRVMLETEPSGMFEALVHVQGSSAEVLGEVSRISPYRLQSDCIQHVIFRKFCYCASHLERKAAAAAA